MSQSDPRLTQVVEYMKSHWPSQVRDEWQVDLAEYPVITKQIIKDLTSGKTTSRNLIRIAGLSGSGKTTQLLPATEIFFQQKSLRPVLVAARVFVPYHPHYQAIKDFYGEENLRKMTDEFSTIMMFLCLTELIKAGYDIILDVTLLDPTIEKILVDMLETGKYHARILLIAAAPEVTEKHLASRPWRHTKETEAEFIRATSRALEFYATNCPEMNIVIWNTYDEDPVYDGPVANAVDVFEKYSAITDIPPHDENALRQAKIEYLKTK